MKQKQERPRQLKKMYYVKKKKRKKTGRFDFDRIKLLNNSFLSWKFLTGIFNNKI